MAAGGMNHHSWLNAIAGLSTLLKRQGMLEEAGESFKGGSSNCLQRFFGLEGIHRWIRTKKEIQGLMAADVFANRPIDAKVLQYCLCQRRRPFAGSACGVLKSD